MDFPPPECPNKAKILSPSLLNKKFIVDSIKSKVLILSFVKNESLVPYKSI